MRVYVEGEIRLRMRGGFIPDEAYPVVVDHTIIPFTDVLVVDYKSRTCYLAMRAIKPMKGIWEIGGGRRKGEKPVEAMRRNFKRETGLDLPEERFQFVFHADHVWQDREEEPQDKGKHYAGHHFVVELSSEELAAARASMEKREYDREFGLQEYTRERMVAENVHPALLHLFDMVMGPGIDDVNLVVQPEGGLQGHDDPRRTITDLLFDPTIPLRHSELVTKGQVTVGNHWHNCVERFVLKAGRIDRLVFEDIHTKVRRVWTNLGPGTEITVPARVAHALVMAPDSVLHMYVSSAESPANKEFFHTYTLLTA